ncbi:hypothetical protein ACVCNH_22235 [Achromobacter anxifer]
MLPKSHQHGHSSAADAWREQKQLNSHAGRQGGRTENAARKPVESARNRLKSLCAKHPHPPAGIVAMVIAKPHNNAAMTTSASTPYGKK